VWGSSGIQLVDMDRDGDLDLLMTNGDSLDDFTVRPFHGVRWFENKASTPGAARPRDHAGVHRAQAADLDGDGDLDVVCTAFLPNAEHPAFQLLERQGSLTPFTSLGWLEQTKPGVFVPHPIETGKLTHTTLDVATSTETATLTSSRATSSGSRSPRPTPASRRTGRDLWVNRTKNPAAALGVTALPAAAARR